VKPHLHVTVRFRPKDSREDALDVLNDIALVAGRVALEVLCGARHIVEPGSQRVHAR
jgi:hypothetical protein